MKYSQLRDTCLSCQSPPHQRLERFTVLYFEFRPLFWGERVESNVGIQDLAASRLIRRDRRNLNRSFMPVLFRLNPPLNHRVRIRIRIQSTSLPPAQRASKQLPSHPIPSPFRHSNQALLETRGKTCYALDVYDAEKTKDPISKEIGEKNKMRMRKGSMVYGMRNGRYCKDVCYARQCHEKHRPRRIRK